MRRATDVSLSAAVTAFRRASVINLAITSSVRASSSSLLMVDLGFECGRRISAPFSPENHFATNLHVSSTNAAKQTTKRKLISTQRTREHGNRTDDEALQRRAPEALELCLCALHVLGGESRRREP